jgi:hypothetical protein
MAWWPLVGARVTRAAAPTLREVGLMREAPRPAVDRFQRGDHIGPATKAPDPGSK